MKRGHPKQMSESFLTAAFLSLSGGLQDAYTYIYRGHVFANAQTGNIVLLSQSIAERNWTQTVLRGNSWPPPASSEPAMFRDQRKSLHCVA